MCYVDAIYDRQRDKIKLAERIDGRRVLREEPVEHVFYYEHPAGTHRTIFGHNCKKFSTFKAKLAGRKRAELAASRRPPTIFESDIRPEFRHLAKHYMGKDAPVLHLAFFDIEVDFDPQRGFAPTDDPFNAVTAVTVYLSAVETLFTLVLCPPTLSIDEAREIGDQFDNTLVFDDEDDLLRTFLDLIDDADVLSGWNSEGYDIPYLVNRIERKLGRDALKRFCLWGQSPRAREYQKFGKTFKTYDLVGRVHLDYLLLYQKHNTQQQHSYRLDFIGEIEVGENKTPYEGTLDDLYKKDFYRFVEYNRQDVLLLVKIDQKRKYIELANQIAHANCVLLKTTVGSVALVEQAIINEMHAMGFIVPDRKERLDDDEDQEERTPVVGAYVAKPKVGVQREVACVDINSLYPSAIRALNMSPETIFGQIRPTATMALVQQRIADGTGRAEAWDGIFALVEVTRMMDQTSDLVTVDFEDGRVVEMTAADLYEYIFNPANHLCVSANGTIIRTDKDGIIPQLLAKWYADRKSMQKKEKAFGELAKGIEIGADLAALLA